MLSEYRRGTLLADALFRHLLRPTTQIECHVIVVCTGFSIGYSRSSFKTKEPTEKGIGCAGVCDGSCRDGVKRFGRGLREFVCPRNRDTVERQGVGRQGRSCSGNSGHCSRCMTHSQRIEKIFEHFGDMLSQPAETLNPRFGHRDCSANPGMPRHSTLSRCFEGCPVLERKADSLAFVGAEPATRAGVLRQRLEALVSDVSKWVRPVARHSLGPLLASLRSEDISDGQLSMASKKPHQTYLSHEAKIVPQRAFCRAVGCYYVIAARRYVIR